VPRLSNKDYLERHVRLKQLWQRHQSAFSVLSYAQQIELHRFFVPGKELTEAQLRAHRTSVTAQEPSLPNRASKLYMRLLSQRSTGTLVTAKAAAGGHRQIRVRSIARPEPDIRKLARAFVALAEQLHAEQTDNNLKEAA
jgi:hypothetical protein